MIAEPDDAEVLEELESPTGRPAVLAPEQAAEERAFPLLRREQHVLEHRHLREELDQLERPGDAAAVDEVGAEAGDVLALEAHLAGRRDAGRP